MNARGAAACHATATGPMVPQSCCSHAAVALRQDRVPKVQGISAAPSQEAKPAAARNTVRWCSQRMAQHPFGREVEHCPQQTREEAQQNHKTTETRSHGRQAQVGEFNMQRRITERV